MQAQAGHPRRARACAAALLTCLLALALVPAGAHASSRTHAAHRHITRSAVALPTIVAEPGHTTDHGGVLPRRPTITAALVAWPATADSSPATGSRPAQTPPVRGPPAKGSA